MVKKGAFRILVFLFVLFYLSPVFSLPQSFSKVELVYKKNAAYPILLENNDSSLFVIHHLNPTNSEAARKFQIECFDFNLLPKWKTPVLEMNYNCDLSSIAYFNSHILFLSKEFSEYHYRHNFILKTIVSPDGIVKNDTAKIFSIYYYDELKKISSQSYSFGCYNSTSKNHLLFTYSNDYNGQYNQGFRFRIMNKDMSLSAENKIELPYPGDECSISNVLYEDSLMNKIYFIAEVYDNLNLKKRKQTNYFLFAYDISTSKLTKCDLKCGAKKISDLKLKISLNKIVIAALITNKKLAPDTLMGASVSSVNASDLTINFEKTIYFTDSLKQRININTNQTKGKYIDPNLCQIRNLEISEDGIALVAEYNKVKYKKDGGKAMLPSLFGLAGIVGYYSSKNDDSYIPDKYYSYNDFILNFDFKGEVVSSKVILKDQEFDQQELLSHSIITVKSKQYFLYNNLDDYLNVLYAHDSIYTKVLSIKEESTTNSDELFYGFKQKIKRCYIYTNLIKEISDKEFVFIIADKQNKKYLSYYKFPD